MFFPIKISDSNQQITKGSRADQFWHLKGMAPYFKKMRPGLKLPKNFEEENNLDQVVEDFHLQAIGFGNWVTSEDRMNYLNAMIIALLDLNRILRFKDNNVGIHKHLAITFGARGRGKALAHFEPKTEIINITRYQDSLQSSLRHSKEVRFLGTGGMGSFSHEYGHFLDYFAGSFLDKNNKLLSLSGGNITAKNRVGEKGQLRFVMDELMEKIIWSSPGKKISPYYKRLQSYMKANDIQSPYLIQRNELFARAFEMYIAVELKRLNITNRFLTDSNYRSTTYLNEKEMTKLLPYFRKLIGQIRDEIK